VTAGLTELGVRCPGCWAAPGELCTGQTSTDATSGQRFHQSRTAEAARRSLAPGGPLAPAERQGIPDAGPPWHPSQIAPQPLVQYSADVMGENMGRHAGYVLVTVDAGPRPPERVIPPAGEAHAFDAARWARRVEVSVSPTGRSARVWVDGREIPAERSASDGE
jgi:hypothetical protein